MSARLSRVLHRSLRETPPKAGGGEGVWLIAEDGSRVLDASGGAAVSCLGHQHPRIIEAMAKQASELAYAHTSFFSSEPAEALVIISSATSLGDLVTPISSAADRKRSRPRSSWRGNISSSAASCSDNVSSRAARAITAIRLVHWPQVATHGGANPMRHCCRPRSAM